MVNAQVLKDHASKYKLGRDNAAEYFRQLFTKHPELAKYYDAEDLDPDSLHKSQKFMMQGMQEMQIFFRLPDAIDDEKKLRSCLGDFKNIYEDNSFPIAEWGKTIDGFLAAMEKCAGGVSADQKKNWEEVWKKSMEEMKKWGWFK
ncbi:unnamed protein product, partial [Mesorhabditis belari]|uniref:Globin family profile domain-containing protein n=1 Tax=Mesorhabditis belari TaxID=2138241 RepID=A0AAF3J7N5_9BILA